MNIIMDREKERLVFPKYKRVAINWEKINTLIKASGYSLLKLSRETGIGISILNESKADHRMNPLALKELCDFLNIKVSDVCEDFEFNRMSNGGSHDRRVLVNWELLRKDANNKGYSFRKLSQAIGKSDSYLSNCQWIGGINEDILKAVCVILNNDYNCYLISNKDKKLEMVDAICDIYSIK